MERHGGVQAAVFEQTEMVLSVLEQLAQHRPQSCPGAPGRAHRARNRARGLMGPVLLNFLQVELLGLEIPVQLLEVRSLHRGQVQACRWL